MKSLKALIVEDSELDEELLLRQLAKADYDVQSIRVQTAADMEKALAERDWDIILSDYALPSFTGLDALRVLKASGRDIPLIIISGIIGEELAVEAMRVGVDDYLMKGNLARLAPAIERELENAASRQTQKRAEAALRRSEENLANAQRIAQIGSWEWDIQNDQLSWSNEIYRIFGLDHSGFKSTYEAFLQTVHPEDRLKVQAAVDASLTQNAVYNHEHRIIRPDGEERIVCEIGEVTFDESGKPLRFIGTVQDITERKAAETEMRLMKSAVDSIVEGIIITDAQNLSNPIIYTNHAFENLTGYAFDEVKGQNCRFLQGTETNPRTVEEIRESFRQEKTFRGEILNYRKNGESFWNELSISPVFDQSGRLSNYVGVQQDISERKQDEEILRASEAKIRQLIDSSIIGITTTRLDGSIIEANDVFLKTVGYSRSELLAGKLRWDEMTPPEIFWQDERAKEQLFKFGYSIPREKEYIRKDGSRVPVMVGGTLLKGTEDTIIAFVLDISEQKRVEEERTELIAELDTEKRRLQHIFDNSPSFILSLRGPDFVFEMANPAYYQLVGQRNLIGIPAREALPEVMTQGLSEITRHVYNTGEPFIGNEVSVNLQPQDGSELEQRYLNFVCMPLREADNSVSGIISYGVDVTEQVLSRTKIQESEERYRFLFKNNPLPMWVFDLETLAFLSVNDAATTHYGYTREEFLTMTVKDIRLPEDLPAFLQNIVIDIPGIVKAGVVRHIKKDGAVIDVEITTNQLIFNRKKAKLVLSNDVTERLKAEESVRFQAHLLNTVEQSVIATDLDGIVIHWNQFAEKLYGWTIAEAVGRNIREMTTSENNQEQANQIMMQLSMGKSWSGEFIVRNKDGEDFPAYISNSPVIDSNGKMTGIVGVSFDITERKSSEEALRKAEASYRNLVESSPAIVYLAEPHPPFSTIYVSPNITRFGYTVEEWFDRPDMWVSLIHDEDRARVLRATENAVAQGEETDMEYRVVAKDEAIVWLHDKGRFVLDEQGNKTGWQGMMVDITKNKELEDQLRQSQKLESVGRLAGGIAHDFNNMLTAINGYSELTLRKLEQDSPLRENIEEIKKAGERSAQLTHQLLAFSRQQVLQPVVLDLNGVITDTIKLLERVIGEDVKLFVALNTKTGRVNVDPGQLSQIIMNLAVNARDAMPNGGKLTIETANIFLKPENAGSMVGVLPGAYVMLAVGDTGQGIDEKIQQQIFEPFFTTKQLGKGTGLGLATVYGIVKQSGGNIEFESKIGVGTTFKVYLPRVAEQPEELEVTDAPVDFLTGTETILLVEDEELVRNLSRKMLETCGYTVIEARDGLEALKIWDAGDCKPDLLITDVVMPQMGGRELAEKVTEKLPDIKILFSSGYAADEMTRYGVIETNTNFIQKPYSFDDLTRQVRRLLDAENLN